MTKKTTKSEPPRTHPTPDEISQAHALREAGYTTLAISQRTGISIASLTRYFAAEGTKKGALKSAIIDQAKQDLLAHITSDQTIKHLAARLLADDLAHSLHLREVILNATAHMVATNLEEAVQVTRAAAAYSTTIKNTSDLIRHSLRQEALQDTTDELPELTVRELTQGQIDEMTKQQVGLTDEDEYGVDMLTE
jgi:AcrR family transcriptional regulator